MPSLNEINLIARAKIAKGVYDQVHKSTPLLDFLKRSELYYVYDRAKDYGYKCEWGTDK